MTSVYKPAIDEAIYVERKKHQKRNQLAFMLESFFFSFALTMTSQQTVIPSYVSKLSGNAIYISLISVIFYGCTYCASVFSCLIGLNAKSPKWSAILVCGLHRIGFLFLFISTFFAGRNVTLALFVFFAAYAFSCTMSGISTPLFNMLIANTTTRSIGAFFGAYNLVGAISGIFASWVLKQCERWFVFPVSFRAIFLLGVVSAVIASLVLMIGIKEVRAPVSGNRIRAKDLPGFFRKVWRENQSYKRFVCTRMIMAAAEFSIPFFIVKAATFENAPVGYLGTASLVLLITKMASSKLLGFVSDRFGAMAVLMISCVCGMMASALILIVKHYFWIIPLFVLVGFIQNGVHVAESVAIISHSDGRNTTVYTALNGILVTPVYILASFIGGVLAERLSMSLVFVVSTVVFLIVFCRILISGLRTRNSPVV